VVNAPAELTLQSFADVRAALATDALVRSIDPARFEHGNIMERVLLMLVGQEHRDRRRVENALFRRERLAEYETEIFPPLLAETVGNAALTGQADLIDLGATLTVVLSGQTAGIDFDVRDKAIRRQLVDYLHVFARGEALDAETGDVDQIRAQVSAALARFAAEYFEPSRRRRADLLATQGLGAGPRDVLTALLAGRDELGLDDATILRETAFFFEAGAHTSTQTFTNSVHYALGWAGEEASRRELLAEDLALAQRCVHEALRLRPTNPAIRRRAVRDLTVGDTEIQAGTLVVLDTATANRDPAVFGDDAEAFDPNREVTPPASRWGHSFGGGMHACIGRNLAVGLPLRGTEPGEDHLFGLVPLMLQSVFQHGVVPSPSEAPVRDEGTRRWTRWRRYPVLFAPARSAIAL
jgi:cytochrome P450